MHVAESDRCQRASGLPNLVLVVAQLRDIVAAKDSTVVPEEDYKRRIGFPQRAKTNFAAPRFGQHEIHQFRTHRFRHAPIIGDKPACCLPFPLAPESVLARHSPLATRETAAAPGVFRTETTRR